MLGNRVEPRGTRKTAMTLVQLGELAVSDVEEKVRVEQLATPAKQPDEQLHRPDIATSRKTASPANIHRKYGTLGKCRTGRRETRIGSDLWVNAPIEAPT